MTLDAAAAALKEVGCEVKKAAISAWEKGRNVPDTLTLRRLARVYRTTTDELAGATPRGTGDASEDDGKEVAVDRELLEVVIFQCVSRGSPLTPAGAAMLREAFDQVGLGRDAADRLIKYTALMNRPSAPSPEGDPATPTPPAQKRAKAAAGRGHP